MRCLSSGHACIAWSMHDETVASDMRREVSSSDLAMHVRQWKDECEKIKERFLREKLSHIKIDL